MIRRVKEFLKRSYYNTNQEEGTTLAASEGRAERQETLVYNFFNENKEESYPRFRLEEMFGWPTQTMSRVLANLTSDGLLEKTDNMVKGPFNKMVHTWKYADAPEKLRTFF